MDGKSKSTELFFVAAVDNATIKPVGGSNYQIYFHKIRDITYVSLAPEKFAGNMGPGKFVHEIWTDKSKLNASIIAAFSIGEKKKTLSDGSSSASDSSLPSLPAIPVTPVTEVIATHAQSAAGEEMRAARSHHHSHHGWRDWLPFSFFGNGRSTSARRDLTQELLSFFDRTDTQLATAWV